MAMDSETPDTSSTNKIASRFEVTLQEGRGRRRGRGRPRGSLSTGTQETTRRRIIPGSQPNSQESIREQVREVVGAVGAGEMVHWHGVVVVG
jgi:hypothetical protein